MEPFTKFQISFIKSEAFNIPKLPFVMAYLKFNAALNNNVGISIELLAKQFGYKPNHRKGKINEQITKSLEWLQARDCIYIMEDLDNVKCNDAFIVNLNPDSEIMNPVEKFVSITENDFHRITTVDSYKQDLLSVYLNIKKYLDNRSHICYPSHRALCYDCQISSTGTMNNIINSLKKIGLLYTYNPGKFTLNGKTKYANNFYSFEDGILDPDKCDEMMRQYYMMQGIDVGEFVKYTDKRSQSDTLSEDELFG